MMERPKDTKKQHEASNLELSFEKVSYGDVFKELVKKKRLVKKKPSKMVQRVDELEKLVNRQEQYSRIHDVFVFQCIE